MARDDEIEQDNRNAFQSVGNGIGKVGKNVGKGVGKSVKVVGSVLEDFKEFLNRGNVVDLAVGIVMGAAFTSIVNSGVSDIITPVISLAVGSSLQNTMLIIACPKLADNKTRGVLGKDCQQGDFATIEIAKNRGAVTWNYGSFLQICINFLITSAIVYFMVKVYAATFRREKPPKVRECDFCCKDVPIKAVKCGFCTSDLIAESDEIEIA